MSPRPNLTLAGPRPAAEPLIEATPAVPRLERESDAHYAKRVAAIRALGASWVNHPAYRFNPLHSTNLEVWMPAQRDYWQRVHDAAAADRARNTAHARTRAVLAAMGAA